MTYEQAQAKRHINNLQELIRYFNPNTVSAIHNTVATEYLEDAIEFIKELTEDE